MVLHAVWLFEDVVVAATNADVSILMIYTCL